MKEYSTLVHEERGGLNRVRATALYHDEGRCFRCEGGHKTRAAAIAATEDGEHRWRCRCSRTEDVRQMMEVVKGQAGDTTPFTAEDVNRVEEILNMCHVQHADSSNWSNHWTTDPPIDITTGKSLTVQPDLSWDTPMVVYCIRCRNCGERYFGKTRCYHIPSYSANALYFLQQ